VGKVALLSAALGLALAAGAVAAQPAITLTADPKLISIATGDASAVVLSGSVAGADAGEDLVFEAKLCGYSSYIPVHRAKTGRGGVFHERLAPVIRTTYRVRAGRSVSAPVTVQTRPAIRFEQLAARSFNVWTIAMQFFRGARGRMERFDRASGKWVLVRRVTLQRGNAPPGAGWAYSEATFTARVRKGTLVRFVLPRNEVRPCYLAGYSVIFNTTR
jgi:hypothetical protein